LSSRDERTRSVVLPAVQIIFGGITKKPERAKPQLVEQRTFLKLEADRRVVQMRRRRDAVIRWEGRTVSSPGPDEHPAGVSVSPREDKCAPLLARGKEGRRSPGVGGFRRQERRILFSVFSFGNGRNTRRVFHHTGAAEYLIGISAWFNDLGLKNVPSRCQLPAAAPECLPDSVVGSDSRQAAGRNTSLQHKWSCVSMTFSKKLPSDLRRLPPSRHATSLTVSRAPNGAYSVVGCRGHRIYGAVSLERQRLPRRTNASFQILLFRSLVRVRRVTVTESQPVGTFNPDDPGTSGGLSQPPQVL